MNYNHLKIEKKWQGIWEKKKIYRPNLDKAKKPFYNLMMFPYPSAEGLHVGNMYAFIHSDTYGRYMKMKGHNVFEPIGLDGFGIHSENYAIKMGEHILDVSKRTEKHFYQQLKMIGNQYDWSRRLETYKPEYYKWTQWIFIQMFKKGLAYRAKSYVNWCPSCKTVLSDEQVINDYCERCNSLIEKKLMLQWFFKITNYVEKLLKNLDWINWSERTKIAQRNWIGKSEGATIKFLISNFQFPINVFTTRLDTIFGCTYLVIAPEHEIILKIKNKISNIDEVEKYIVQSQKKSEIERVDFTKEKTGVEIKGIKAINPFNDQEIPIFVADYVLAHYGTGAVMAVPAHDERDFEFAKKYGLSIIEVIKSLSAGMTLDRAFIEDGVLVNSGEYNGFNSVKAREKMAKWLEQKKVGGKKVQYKLRDWCISRQRYWGPPIPMIWCQKCDWQPVLEKDLPVLLPKTKDYLPRADGLTPLARNEKFWKTKCPKCGEPARRETDVSDTFLDSAWYFFRYPSVEFDNKIFDQKRTKKWLPVDMYIGGHEHAVLHLLYSRFITMFFHDLGLIDFEEPYKRFFAHGFLTCDGAKMSKSKGNVVIPDEYIKRYGADAVRMYLMFLGPVEQDSDWRDLGMRGMFKFVNKIWNLFENIDKNGSGVKDLSFIHKTIKKVSDDLERLSFNTAIARIMEYVNWYKEKEDNFTKKERKKFFENLSLLLAPFAPHLAEELWQKYYDYSVHDQSWPKYNSKLIEEKNITLIVQVNGKMRDKIETKRGINEKKLLKEALSNERIKKWTIGKKIKRTFFIKDRLINIIIP